MFTCTDGRQRADSDPEVENFYEDLDVEEEEKQQQNVVPTRRIRKVERRANAKSLPRDV